MPDLPLATSELTQMRHTVEAYLPGTAVLHTATRASDSQGGQTWTYAASSTVDARLSPVTGGEAEVAARISERNAYTLTIPWETSIDADDRAVYDSVTYEVIHVRDRTPWELSRRVFVVEVA